MTESGPVPGHAKQSTPEGKNFDHIDTEENGIDLIDSKCEGHVSQLQTKRGLKSRHTQMIAIGGTIGTGLFVGSGQALQIGGPLFLLLGYSLLTCLVFCVVSAVTEFTTFLPVPGSSIPYFGNRFVSKSMGFALGWIYYYIFAIQTPSEITAAALVLEYWNSPVHVAVWITILMVVIVGLNCFPIRIYGETEFWFSAIKIIGIIGILIMALVITCGGGPNHESIGFAYWKNPGPVNEYILSNDRGRLVAFIATLRFSVYVFAFSPELLVITAGEMKSPRRNLPTACRRFFIRLVVFYILGAFFMGMIIPSNDNRLLGAGYDASASPWAIAAKNAGIKGLDSVINAVILLSAWSAGNSWLYLASRTLYSMSVFGKAPQIFSRCTESGVPYVSLAFSSLFCLLAYLNVSSSTATVFNWFINLINSGAYLGWVCVFIVYIRFRKATIAQNIYELPYRSSIMPYGAYVGAIIFALLLLLNGFTVFFPGHWDLPTFITSYIGIPIFFVLLLGHKLLFERQAPWWIAPAEVDLQTGLQEIILGEVPAASSESEKKWYSGLAAIFS